MIIVTKPGATEEQIDHILDRIREWGLKAEVSRGAIRTVIGVIGPEDQIREKPIAAIPGVESATPVLKPYKLVAREFRGGNSGSVKIGGVEVGGSEIVVMSGPCSVENREQITGIAQAIKKGGAKILRGGAFKPRTSPYAFQGLGEDGLKLLAEAREATGLPIVTEAVDEASLELVDEYADVVQIGARNMHNYELLKRAGRLTKPILLKRGMSATLEELLLAAEYILTQGNPNVILCERGIRTFSRHNRYTLDLSIVPAEREVSHLPMFVDPSHATGRSDRVPAMARAAVAAGADGVIIEFHPSPDEALSDGRQALRPAQAAELFAQLRAIAATVARKAEAVR